MGGGGGEIQTKRQYCLWSVCFLWRHRQNVYGELYRIKLHGIVLYGIDTLLQSGNIYRIFRNADRKQYVAELCTVNIFCGNALLCRIKLYG